MRGMMFFIKCFLKRYAFLALFYIFMLVYYDSNYNPIYKLQVLNNQKIKLFTENLNLTRNLTF